MAEALIASILFVPFILARVAAGARNPRRGFRWLLVAAGVFHVAYVLSLMFLYLRLI